MKYFFCIGLFNFLHVLDYLHMVGFSLTSVFIDVLKVWVQFMDLHRSISLELFTRKFIKLILNDVINLHFNEPIDDVLGLVPLCLEEMAVNGAVQGPEVWQTTFLAKL